MPKTKKQKKAPLRDDGRRAVTVYMLPDTIKALKIAAMEDEKHEFAYQIVEEAVLDWLKVKKKRR